MKVVSYALFGDPDSFEFPFYLRGLYFNARMNLLIYPTWLTQIHVASNVYDLHKDLLNEMQRILGFAITVLPPAPKCEAMLWRMLPIYANDGATHVICRDTDAITTYREAQAVQEWVDSDLAVHGITDDPAHTIPIMGGMCGFRPDRFKQIFPHFATFRNLIGKFKLDQHGSDQNLLMQYIWPKVKNDMMGHFFKGCTEQVKDTRHAVWKEPARVSPKLWTSNLTCRMIGSPGVVDMETLRFFKGNDKLNLINFESKYPEIFYWAR